MGKKWGTRSGFTLTTLSMVIQGILAFLLWEVVWRNLARNYISAVFYELILYIVGIPLFAGSVIGKVALVFPYNKASFERLGISMQRFIENPKELLLEIKNDFRQWTVKDYIRAAVNGIMTINVALVFAVGLTNLGANGIANLLKAYNKPFLNKVAEFIITYYFQSPFITASLICNILGFPYVHINAVTRIKKFFTFLITNPSYLHLKDDLLRCILATSFQWKTNIEQKNSGKITNILTELCNISPEAQFHIDINRFTMQQAEEILMYDVSIERIIKYGKPNIVTISPEWGFEFVLTRSLTTIILAIVLRGLFNFFTYSEKTMNLMSLPFLSKPSGVLDYLSMSAIALDAVFIPTVAFLQSLLFGRRYEASIISGQARFALALLTVVLIGLGGFPNGYQEAQLGGNVLQVGMAIFAAWIELFGTYNLITNSIEKSKINKNPYDKLVYGLNNKIKQITEELAILQPAQLKELAAVNFLPDHAEKVYRIPPERKCFSKLKENIRHCIWSRSPAQQTLVVSDTPEIERAALSF
jgi:hypothetical protein